MLMRIAYWLIVPFWLLIGLGNAKAQLIKNGSFEDTLAGPGFNCNRGACTTAGAFTHCFTCEYVAGTPGRVSGWTVDEGNIDLFYVESSTPYSNYQQSNVSPGPIYPSGNYAVDMNGSLPGTISQVVEHIVAGTDYQLSFSYTNNTYLTGEDCNFHNGYNKTLRVTVYDNMGNIIVTNDYRTDTAATPMRSWVDYSLPEPPLLRWADVLLTFTATSNPIKVEFKSLFNTIGTSPNYCGFTLSSPHTIFGPILDNVMLLGEVLPVSLQSFAGTHRGNQFHLSWETADEQNLAKMVVQYMGQDGLWQDIGTVLPKGAGKYDLNIPAGTMAYFPQATMRLALISKANKNNYSPVINIPIKQAAPVVNIRPNPVMGGRVAIDGLRGGEDILLYNIHGQRMLYRKAANPVEQVNIGHLPAGFYKVSVVTGFGPVIHRKLIKGN